MIKKPQHFLILSILTVITFNTEIIKKKRHSKHFIHGRNLSAGANAAGKMRFVATKTAAKAAAKTAEGPQGSPNPQFLLKQQWTTTDEQCIGPCKPNEASEGEQDECEVRKNERRECVRIANVNDMRDIWVESRKKALGAQDSNQNMVEAIIPEFAPKQGTHDHIQAERKRQLKVVQSIKEIKLKIEAMVKTLKGDADNLEKLKMDLEALKGTQVALQAETKNPPADCTGLPGYQKKGEGNGLTAMFQDNLEWKGDPVLDQVKNVDMFLIGESPAKDINPNNFTVEYKGYIVAPKSDSQTLYCESDDGCLIEIGGTEVLNDGCEVTNDFLAVKFAALNDSIKNGEFAKFVQPETPGESTKFPRSSKGKPVDLKAGEFAEISIRAFHSVHNSMQESGHAWVMLSWESPNIKREIIPTSALWSQIEDDELKPTDQDAKVMMLDTVAEMDNAFLDTDTWKMKFVPQEFRGSYMLKARKAFDLEEVRFMINKKIKLQVGWESTLPIPVGSDFIVEKKQVIALEKQNKNDKIKLEMGEIVPAPEEIVIKLAYKEFPEGEVKVPLAQEDNMKILVMIIPDMPPDKSSCAGSPVNVSSADSGLVDKCDPEGTLADNECAMAFAANNFWKSKDTPSIVTQFYTAPLLPVKLIQKPDPASGKWPMFVKIYQSETEFEKFKVQGEENEFQLENGVETTKVTLEMDKGEAGGQFEVWGIPCTNITKKEKLDNEKKLEVAGKVILPKDTDVDCTTALETMATDTVLITCKEICGPTDESGKPTFELAPDGQNQTKTSKICAAAADFFKADTETLEKKKYGVKKIPNPDNKNEQWVGFDMTVGVEKVKWEKGKPVDVMTGENCFSRGEIEAVNDGTIKVKVNGESVVVMSDNVQKCGYELAEPCGKLETTEVNIKFCAGGGPLEVCKNKLKSWTYFDTGDDVQPDPSGSFEFGWSKKDPNRMIVSSKLDQGNETTVQENTAALLDEKTEGDWVFRAINGFYHVKIDLKYTKEDKIGKEAAKRMAEFEFLVNEHPVKGVIKDMSVIIKEDIPKLKVDKKEIRIKWVKGHVSILSIVLMPHPADPQVGSKKEITKAKTPTFINCPYKEDVVNCAQHERELNKVECPGIFEKLDWDDAPEVKCMMKCTDKLNNNPVAKPGPPTDSGPPKEEKEVEVKELKQPMLEHYWCMEIGKKKPDSIFQFKSDREFKVQGKLADRQEKGQGEQEIEGDWVNIQFSDPVDKAEVKLPFFVQDENVLVMSENPNCEEDQVCPLYKMQKMTKDEVKKFKDEKR